MFLAPEEFLIPASLRESDELFKRQQALRREVMTELVVAAFDTPEKLASAVTRALFVWHEGRRQAEPAVGADDAGRAGTARQGAAAERRSAPIPIGGWRRSASRMRPGSSGGRRWSISSGTRSWSCTRRRPRA